MWTSLNAAYSMVKGESQFNQMFSAANAVAGVVTTASIAPAVSAAVGSVAQTAPTALPAATVFNNVFSTRRIITAATVNHQGKLVILCSIPHSISVVWNLIDLNFHVFHQPHIYKMINNNRQLGLLTRRR